MTFKATFNTTLSWSWDEGGLDNSKLSYNKSLTDGTGNNQAEAVWHKEDVELLEAASTTYDLTALTRTVLGDTHTTTFVSIKAILIVNKETSTTAGGQIVVGGAASNEWSEPFGADGDTVVVPWDSPMELVNRLCTWEVDATNKNLKLTASGGDVTYSIAIVGLLSGATGDCSSSA